MKNFRQIIIDKANKKILYTAHVIKQMNAGDRLISSDEVENKIYKGSMIEDYPEDTRGHSCLINSRINSRPIHVVCAPKDEYLAVITAYIPDVKKWDSEFKMRKK
ncbi:MAG: DUF4258 domain-containing protein [Candidatus Heimdallarchaeota archaeon]|nr:DUF4258 domain-containing protein [Candidatus Heimdallarchaeota archaeon]